MSKKPELMISKTKRLSEAKFEFENEDIAKETKQTTIMLDVDLFYAMKEVCLKRKRMRIEPNTLTGIIKQALKEIINKERNK